MLTDMLKLHKKRIDSIVENPEDDPFRIYNPRKEPRIPFGSLLEHGLLKPGEKLFYKANERQSAVIQSDGSLEYNGQIGSIHKIASSLGKASNNGWVTWYYRDAQSKNLEPIDKLRQIIRKEIIQ